MCGNSNFALTEAYFTHVLQENLGNINIAGKSVPCMSIICTDCGFISMHALGALGLLPGPVEEESRKTTPGGEE